MLHRFDAANGRSGRMQNSLFRVTGVCDHPHPLILKTYSFVSYAISHSLARVHVRAFDRLSIPLSMVGVAIRTPREPNRNNTGEYETLCFLSDLYSATQSRSGLELSQCSAGCCGAWQLRLAHHNTARKNYFQQLRSEHERQCIFSGKCEPFRWPKLSRQTHQPHDLSLIHISEPTRPY